MSSPSSRTLPEVGSSSLTSSRAVVLLPQPVSPTIPSVSPGLTENETPSTALTAPVRRCKMMPWVIGKCLTRSRTSSRASPEDSGCWTACSVPAAAIRSVLGRRVAQRRPGGDRLGQPTQLRGYLPSLEPLPDPLSDLGLQQARHVVAGVVGHGG